jgi:hypothetical protein
MRTTIPKFRPHLTLTFTFQDRYTLGWANKDPLASTSDSCFEGSGIILIHREPQTQTIAHLQTRISFGINSRILSVKTELRHSNFKRTAPWEYTNNI